MRAALFKEPYLIEVSDLPMPNLGPGEALVAMRAAGICGSDLHFYDGSHPYAQYPSVYGHELAGVVEQVGPGVTKVRAGDRVVVEPAIPCGRCFPCRSGKYNCCVEMQFVGAFGRHGGFAEFAAVPERCLHRIPDGLKFAS